MVEQIPQPHQQQDAGHQHDPGHQHQEGHEAESSPAQDAAQDGEYQRYGGEKTVQPGQLVPLPHPGQQGEEGNQREQDGHGNVHDDVGGHEHAQKHEESAQK